MLPPHMNTTRLKITFDLSVYGTLNVTAVDSLGSSRSILVEPRGPSEAEIARMEAEAAALAEREDVMRRMQTFRAYIAHYRPVLTRQLSGLAANNPQRGVRTQIVETLADVEAWMAKRILSASREQFLGKLEGLESLLRQDVELGNDFLGGTAGNEGG